MMIHKFIKYLVQTRLRLLLFLYLTNEVEFGQICYFYISQTKSSLDKIFYKGVYHHIIYMCDFFSEFRQFFIIIYTNFHKNYGFHQICSLYLREITPLSSIWNC